MLTSSADFTENRVHSHSKYLMFGNYKFLASHITKTVSHQNISYSLKAADEAIFKDSLNKCLESEEYFTIS